MHEDSCIGISYAHIFPKCFKSLHTLLGFALCFMSSILIIVAVTIYSILTCTRIPYRDSHCGNGSFEVLSLQFFPYRSHDVDTRNFASFGNKLVD